MTPIKSYRSTTPPRRGSRALRGSTLYAMLGALAVTFAFSPTEARAELVPGWRQRVTLADVAALENFGLHWRLTATPR